MSAIVLTTKPFQLVNFIAVGRPCRTRNVDITLLKWIRCDEKKLVTKYMPPPYNDETNDVLYNLLEKQTAAPKDWSEYPIKIVGHAEMDAVMYVPKLSDTNLPLLLDKYEADPLATEDEIDSDASSAYFQGKGSDVVPTGKHFSQNRCEPEKQKRKIGCNYDPSYNEEKGSGRRGDERDYSNVMN